MRKTGPSSLRTDRELAWRVAEAGDDEAFRALFDRHSPRLLRFVMRLTAGDGIAEDLVQETWVRAVERLDGFRWCSSFSTWLQGIALNTARETLRRRFAMTVVDVEQFSVAAQPDSDRALRIDLERALTRLPPGRRTVLVLHDLYGYKHTEIADSLEISVGTSKSQLHEARRQLEILLAGGVDDGGKRA